MPEIDAKSVVMFAAASVVLAIVLCFALRLRKRSDPSVGWLIASNLSLLLAAVGMLAQPLIGFELSSMSVIAGTLAGMSFAFFAVLRLEGERPPFMAIGGIGSVCVAVQAVVASTTGDATALMLTSSAANSVITLCMTAGVWRRIRRYGASAATLMALPFASFFTSYFIRLIVVLIWPDGQGPLVATIMIIMVMAWSAVVLELGIIALRETKARRQLADALKRLEVASAARSRFLLSISHELRTPLNAVLGLSELMRAESAGPLTDAYRTFVGHIHENGRSLLGLVTDLLDIAAVENGALALDETRLDLAALVRELAETMRGAAETGGVRLVVDSEFPATLVFRGDAARLRRMIVNLVDNAVRYVGGVDGAGGEVSVALRRAADGGPILTVSDDGPGMSEEGRVRALELFGRINGVGDAREGVGVGLPLAAEIARAHGGRLTLETAPGEGVIARIALPASRLVDTARTLAPASYPAMAEAAE